MKLFKRITTLLQDWNPTYLMNVLRIVHVGVCVTDMHVLYVQNILIRPLRTPIYQRFDVRLTYLERTRRIHNNHRTFNCVYQRMRLAHKR